MPDHDLELPFHWVFLERLIDFLHLTPRMGATKLLPLRRPALARAAEAAGVAILSGGSFNLVAPLVGLFSAVAAVARWKSKPHGCAVAAHYSISCASARMQHEELIGTPTFTIVLPCHNEAARIADLLRTLEGWFGSRAAVLVVDDGATTKRRIARNRRAIRMSVCIASPRTEARERQSGRHPADQDATRTVDDDPPAIAPRSSERWKGLQTQTSSSETSDIVARGISFWSGCSGSYTAGMWWG